MQILRDNPAYNLLQRIAMSNEPYFDECALRPFTVLAVKICTQCQFMMDGNTCSARPHACRYLQLDLEAAMQEAGLEVLLEYGRLCKLIVALSWRVERW